MTTYDLVVVGSGFGGAVAACRAAAAGRRVLVLERGRRWEPADYPRKPGDPWRYSVRKPHKRNGWFDIRFLDGDMIVVSGAGVGGGSLAYANVSIDAGPEVFTAGWPAAITYDVLKPYYETVGEMLRPNRIPTDQEPARLALMRRAATAIGAADRFETVDLAVTFGDTLVSAPWRNPHGKEQGTCTHCGRCDIGCDVRAKNTLDLNYLAAAENSGAEIRPLSYVNVIARSGDRWRVHYDDVSNRTRTPAFVDAERVVLAAGSLGSTEILMRSQAEATLPKLPAALGAGWSSNGDFATPAWYRGRKLAPTSGPTITSAIDFLDGSRGGRVFIEDGGLPNIVELLCNGTAMPKTLRDSLVRHGELQSIMPWFGQSIDGSDGDFRFGRRLSSPWRKSLRLDWNPRRSELAIDSMSKIHHELSKATGGRPLPRLMWHWFRGLVTPHPLGGCNMATAPGAGVVDDACRVFGHPGLYVMDGAVIPRAVGRNPSKTIAAVAERAMEHLLAEPA